MSGIQLSPEQQYALDRFNNGENLFITGPGGTGKTKLISYFVRSADERAIKIDVCALTGCAALLLNCGARTLHSWSGIRLAKGPREKLIASVLKNRRALANWKKAKILVIDEVSMMSEKIFELCDDIGRAVRKVNRPFGGIQIICTGDFYQLPPVGTPGEPDTERFCFESERWVTIFKNENHIQLHTMFRQKDPKYREILLQIRKGELEKENAEILQTRVKRTYNPEEHGGCVLTKLFPVRSRAEYINQLMYAKIEQDENVYMCNRKTACKTYVESGVPIKTADLLKCDMLTEKEKEMHLEQLLSNSPAVESLSLKVGTAVMCLTNLDLEAGICNGSQGIIVKFVPAGEGLITAGTVLGELAPVVRFTNGCVRVIERHVWQSDEYPSLYISQYPLCLAWALTIHKIQGATMDMAEMDLGNAIFEYGQTYVALSRIQTLDGLYLSAFHPQRIKANPKVRAFYDSIIQTPIAMQPVETTTVDWEQFAHTSDDTPDDTNIKAPAPVASVPAMKDPNVKVIRL
uniref:AAA+ ATPase domain-containing protein n=1 Tax=viral metagenome TaxID=1070528 RepID=A0A6C0JZ66_9ZZZZ